MHGNFFRGVVLGSVTAALVLSATAALAGTGVGGVFNLGKTNTVNGTSRLTGSSSAGPLLVVSNTSTTAKAALQANAASGFALLAHNTGGAPAAFMGPASYPPFVVGSSKTVVNLSADTLDGVQASGFLRAGGKAANADLLDGLHSTGFLPVGGTAANASKLGGYLPSWFLPATGTAANASKLGGFPAASFYRLRTGPVANVLTTLDGGQYLGFFTSATIGTDGLPVIGYYDSFSGHLKVAHCGNAACSSGNTLTTVDSGDEVGQYASAVIGADGLPLIGYYDATQGDLKVAHCSNLTCSAATLRTLDSTGDVGSHTSVTVGADGLPLISYLDATNYDLRVAHCGDVTCGSATRTTVDSSGEVGLYTSVTTGADGLPLISYYDSTNGDLKVAHCNDLTCSSATLSTLAGADDVGSYTSVTVGVDGLPLISYQDSTNGDLEVAHCGDAACGLGTTITTVDSGGTVGLYTSVTVGPDGLPLVAYYDDTNQDLKVAHCADRACSSAATLTTVDGSNRVGRYASLTIGADGLPLIAYRDDSFDNLKVAHCANTFCVPYFRRR